MTITPPTKHAPLLLSAEEGNLSAVKTLLHDRNNTQQIVNSNQCGDTALSLAAKNSHFAVVDYLIRYHYLGKSFNANETKALNSLSQNNKFGLYFQLLQLLITPDNHKEIKSLLETAKAECEADDLSAIYLLYLWMNVHSNTQTALGTIDSEYKEPPMHQLTSSHQSELILHMIREGYVLKNWYINSNELTITDMLIDKKQVDALEQLLQQGQYQFCLKAENQLVEEGKIYINVDLDGLHYTVLDRNEIRQAGLIALDALEDTVTAPLTLDQLQSLPKLLEQITHHGYDLRPSLERLILKNVRFTKQYHIREKKGHIYENMFYVEIAGGTIQYTVIAPSGKKIIDTFSVEELIRLGWRPRIPTDTLSKLISDYNFRLAFKKLISRSKYILEHVSSLLIRKLQPIFANLLAVTTQRGHTKPEANTMGYATFLTLLENPILASKLHTLHLENCDLFDDYDLPELCDVLPKCPELTHVNLDNNHISYQMARQLLGSLSPIDKLVTLSLRFNEIAIGFASEINLLVRPTTLTEIRITGNRCAQLESFIKLNHQKRVIALQNIFKVLSKKEPNLTVELFLSATNIQLKPVNGNHLLTMTLSDSRIVEVILHTAEYFSFNDLKLQIGDKGRLTEISNPTPQGIFSHLISGIPKNGSLVSCQVSPTKELCKQLLYHHVDAPLKGQLKNHSLFKTERIEACPSYLFPDKQITAPVGTTKGQGFVYLIANDFWVSQREHALLGYEYLTSNGQRIFKVAHLRNIDDNIVIRFEEKDLTSLVSWLPKRRLIAPFRVDSHLLKKMHQSIIEDTDHATLPDVIYSSTISRTSRDEKHMNCLIYCLNKMKNYLNIDIELSLIDYRPSALVRACIKAQAQEQEVNTEYRL